MIFSHYDRIRIVNLETRTDRRREMEQELASVGLQGDTRVAFFPAYRFDDPGPFLRVGSRGAFHSHLTILKEAADAGESVLILQDDCNFLPETRTYAFRDFPDVFYGGYEAADPADLANSDIIGAHFMGFSAEAARKAAIYLEAFLEPDFVPDPVAAQAPGFDPAVKPPIDGALVWFRRKHPELGTQFAMLSTQRSSRTDIGNLRFFDRIWGLKQMAAIARAAKRASGRKN